MRCQQRNSTCASFGQQQFQQLDCQHYCTVTVRNKTGTDYSSQVCLLLWSVPVVLLTVAMQ